MKETQTMPIITDYDRNRIGKFTSDQIYRLMSNGKRPMTEEELKDRPISMGNLIEDVQLLDSHALTYIMECCSEALTGLPVYTQFTQQMQWRVEHQQEALEHFAQLTGKQTLVTENGTII